MANRDASCATMMANWTKVCDVNRTLQIPLVATKLLQRSDLTMSDLYGCWLNMERKLKQMVENEDPPTNLALIFHQKVFERKQVLLENPMLITAAYLDARFNFTLTEIQIQRAKSTLISLYRKIKQNEREQSEEPSQSVNNSFEEYCAVTSKKRARTDDDSLDFDSNQNVLMSVDEFIIFIEAFDNTVDRP